MNTEGKVAYITVTPNGMVLSEKLRQLMKCGEIYTTQKVKECIENKVKDNLGQSIEDYHVVYVEAETKQMIEPSDIHIIEGRLSEAVEELFVKYDTLVFIMATGIVVRVIAPYIVSKFKDPAVIVIDEKGEHVISLLSGHMGGANEMTRKISRLLKAHPVITTATDVNQKSALDMMAKGLNAYIKDFREKVKVVNYALIQEEPVGLYVAGDYEGRVDGRGFVRLEALSEEALKVELKELKYVVYISHERNHPLENWIPQEKLIKVVPRHFVLGVGCKKGTDIRHMLQSYETYMISHNIDSHAVSCIGSIDIKKEEPAIKGLSESLNIPFKVFTKEEIKPVEQLFEGSDFVKQTVGISCVAEPVAYLLGSQVIVKPKEKYQGITFALGKA